MNVRQLSRKNEVSRKYEDIIKTIHCIGEITYKSYVWQGYSTHTIKNACISSAKRQTNLKRGKKLEHTFLPRRYIKGQQAHGKQAHHHWSLGEWESKPQWSITSQPLGEL